MNEAVTAADNVPAKENNLVPSARDAPGNKPKGQKTLPDSEDSGDSNTTTRTVGGVSQTVTWTAKFVDRLSEVTDAMNISGGLSQTPLPLYVN